MKNDHSPPQNGESRELKKWKEYLDTLDWGPGNRDESGFKAALRSASLGVDAQDAALEIGDRITSTGGTYSLGKITSQLKRAHDFINSGETVGNLALPKCPVLKFDPKQLEALASKAPGIDREWLKQRSPVKVEGLTSGDFLEQLYVPGEKVLVFKSYFTQGDIDFEVGGENKPIQRFTAEGVWFLSNPVDGQFHANPRMESKESRRSKEAVTDWRYMVIESDLAKEGAWLSVLVQLPLQISAIYTSGGKSIHALVRLDAQSKEEWDKMRDLIRTCLVPVGADPNAMTAVRLSRLPGVKRGLADQELLYLNPNPTPKPIFP